MAKRDILEDSAALGFTTIVSDDMAIEFARRRKPPKPFVRQPVQLKDVSTKSRFGKRNPEDNLGKCIGESEIPKTDVAMDADAIGRFAMAIAERKGGGAGVTSVVNEEDMLKMCRTFEYRLNEIVKALVDMFPDEFGIGFLRSRVRPFVHSLRKEKIGYENGFEGYEYKRIFRYIG